MEGIASSSRASGHQNYAVFGRKSQPGPTETLRASGRIDMVLHGVQSLMMDAHGLGSKRSTRRLLQRIDKIEPDVIGLHNLHGYYINAPHLFDFLRQKRLPVFWTLHDCWPFTGHCSYFDRFDCMRWQTTCHDCPMTSFYPRSLVDRSTYNHRWKKEAFSGVENLTIVTPSEWLANHVRNSFLEEYPVQVIPNGIDLNCFDCSESSVQTDGPVTILGVANRWDERKGLSDFSKLRSTLPEDWHIILVGVDQKQKARLPAGIEGIPRTESVDQLVQLYSMASVYVNPTYSDNFPTTNIEALACGTPVVTYRTGGSPEALDQSCGRVVEAGDIEGLATAVETIAKKDRHHMRRVCRWRAECQYDRNTRFQQYVELAETLLNTQRNTTPEPPPSGMADISYP